MRPSSLPWKLQGLNLKNVKKGDSVLLGGGELEVNWGTFRVCPYAGFEFRTQIIVQTLQIQY